jgi:hypothetical protein
LVGGEAEVLATGLGHHGLSVLARVIPGRIQAGKVVVAAD